MLHKKCVTDASKPDRVKHEPEVYLLAITALKSPASALTPRGNGQPDESRLDMTIEPSFDDHLKDRQLRAAPGMNGWCGIQDCNQPQFDSLPLCEDHSWDVWRKMEYTADSLRSRGAAVMRKQAWDRENIEKLRAQSKAKAAGTYKSDPGTIYYLQVEDKIKIGFTTDLPARMNAYPPMARLLATHPGTFALEAAMHKKFNKWLAGRREWFHAGKDLIEHIEQVRIDFKQTDLAA